MTNSDEPREHAHDATGSPWRPGRPVLPGVTRRRFLRYTALGSAAAAAVAAGAGPAGASVRGTSAAARALPRGWTGTIADLKHVVILMQENRSFDHYFGTLQGVRGFARQAGPQVPERHQHLPAARQEAHRPRVPAALPHGLDQGGRAERGRPGPQLGRRPQRAQRRAVEQLGAAKTEQTMGYFTRDDLPFQYALADAFTICDGYHQSILAPDQPEPDVLLDRDVAAAGPPTRRTTPSSSGRRRTARSPPTPSCC